MAKRRRFDVHGPLRAVEDVSGPPPPHTRKPEEDEMIGTDPMMDAALDDIMKAIRLIVEEPATNEQFKRDVLRAGLFKFAASIRRSMP